MKYLYLILIALSGFFSGCATTNPLNDYPPIPSGKGQLVIFSVKQVDPKLRFGGEIECNGVLCARVIGNYRDGLYSTYSLDSKDVLIKAPGKKFVLFAGEVQLTSNALKVKIEPGKRVVVRVTLVSGSEFVNGAGAVGNAIQTYRIELVSEKEALPIIRNLTELKLTNVNL